MLKDGSSSGWGREESEARGKVTRTERVILRSVLKCAIKIAGDADCLMSSISDSHDGTAAG